MGAIEFLILALATWRLSSLVVNEEGPFGVFDKFRCRVGVYDNEPGWLGKGLACIWCCSVWFGAAWALVYWLWPPVVWLALPLALSAGAIVVDRLAV